jgi:perosamine synthetase
MVVGPGDAMIDEVPLSQPQINDADVEMVVRALRSGRLSIGPMVETFEARVAKATRRRHAVACSSGTAGLHLALAALNIGPGDEVITTPFSFIASANCIPAVGAKPVFVDIDPISLNMDPARIEAAITPSTRAILAVECFGNPTHMDVYRRIADRHEIRLIEDACEGLGGRLRGRPVGGFGHAAVFGFYPNKQITTGEGGVVVTDDDRVAELCRSMRNQGRGATGSSSSGAGWMEFVRFGFNYRMSELAAALGVSQIGRLEQIVEQRADVANRYIERLMDHPDLILPTVDDHTDMSWFVFVVRLNDRYTRDDRDRVIEGMRRHDVGAAAYFPCIHLQEPYRRAFGLGPGAFPIAERVSDRTLALPFYTDLAPRDQDFAAATFELMLRRSGLSRE